ncbi:MAG TPA: hypothetical protein VM452_20810 [Caulifigura sp.]|jgi:hypothetical protein|nr:hypothetical protein [Caulifigura sp.]
MSTSTSEVRHNGSLAVQITAQVEELILESERTQKPLEVDPYRSRLFELFVTAHGAGLVAEGALTADGLCQTLATRWGLRTAAQSSVRDNARLPPEHMARMRSLWSMMRMWMEWTYAWQRWDEFHRVQA